MSESPFASANITYNPQWFPLITAVLGDDVCLLYSGIMVALGKNSCTELEASVCEEGYGPQKWHADGDHLFKWAHQPAHCLNVFVPLVNLSQQNGPTEFAPGTHIESKSAFTEKEDTFPICAKVMLRSIPLLFPVGYMK
eukprot:gene18245-21746_t